MSTASAELHGFRIINITSHAEGIHNCQYPGCKQNNLKRIVHVENAGGDVLHIGVECAKKLMGIDGYRVARVCFEVARRDETVRQARITATLASIALWEALKPGAVPAGSVYATRKGHLRVDSPCGTFLVGENWRGVWMARLGSEAGFQTFAKGDPGLEQAGAAITSEVVAYLKQSLANDSAAGR